VSGTAPDSKLHDDLIAAIPNMRAFAISLCGNRDHADDLVQEALVKAWNHLDSFEEGTNLKAWLFTILRNAYFSELRKTKREINLMRGKLLRFLRRNVGQVEALLGGYAGELKAHEREFLMTRLETVRRIYGQQTELWRTKARSVKNRIVSLHMPHIRPIVRGTTGRDVEFGAKALLSWVDGYCFLDKLGFEAYNEGEDLAGSLEKYKERFGSYPVSSTGDGIFGSRDNREHLKLVKVRGGFKALGRNARSTENQAWYRERQKRRSSRMEGIIGLGKNKFGLDRVRYRMAGGEEMWARLGLMAMNLTTALRKMEARATA